MKKLITFFIISIICIINVFPAIQSYDNYDDDELQTVVYSQQDIFEEHDYDREDLNYDFPEMLDSSHKGTSNTHLFFKAKIPIESHFSYEGNNSLKLDTQLLHVLDSIIKKDTILKHTLDKFIFTYKNNTLATLKLASLLNDNILEKEINKKQEAKAYLAFPIFSILCIIMLMVPKYRKKSETNDFFKQIIALLLVASIIGTGITISTLFNVFF